MKKIFLLLTLGLLVCTVTQAQNRLIDKAAKVSFYSESPAENIEATTSQALGILDLTNGKVAASILMKSFNFEKALMQEHFNENYVESDKFPKATFSGTFDSEVDFTKLGEITVTTSGKLTIHGVTKPMTATLQMNITDSQITASTKMLVKVADYEIDIPKVVASNIAEEIEITADFKFNK